MPEHQLNLKVGHRQNPLLQLFDAPVAPVTSIERAVTASRVIPPADALRVIASAAASWPTKFNEADDVISISSPAAAPVVVKSIPPSVEVKTKLLPAPPVEVKVNWSTEERIRSPNVPVVAELVAAMTEAPVVTSGLTTPEFSAQ